MTIRFATIADLFAEVAKKKPYDVAVVETYATDQAGRRAYIHQTYEQMDKDSGRLAYGLANLGLEKGERAVVMMRPSTDYFSLLLALFKLGVVPVYIDAGMELANAGRCVAESEPVALFADEGIFSASVMLGWAKESIRLRVCVGSSAHSFGVSLNGIRDGVNEGTAMEPAAMQPEETGMIIYTSGSTGVAKGTVIPHSYLSGVVTGLGRSYNPAYNESILSPFPIFTLFNFGVGLKNVIADMDAAQPAMADPIRIIRQIEDVGIQFMFVTPAFMELLERKASPAGLTFPSLRRVLWAGAPVHPSLLARFKRLMPNADLICLYSSTEASPIAMIESAEILETANRTETGGGMCLGRIVPGIEVKIIAISDGPVANWDSSLEVRQGEIGEICVRGTNVSPSYLHRPDATKMAKIADSRDGTFFHRMGDLGYLDEAGRLWFCGRKDHRVDMQGQILMSCACEGVFDAHPQVQRSGLAGVRQNGKNIPVLCVEPKYGKYDAEQLRKELLKLAQLHTATNKIETILFHPRLPVDTRHNSKIVREKLASWAAKRLEETQCQLQ
jgi:acyl-CoA synthetase (AMP-forming)/AMP-acid ligase II